MLGGLRRRTKLSEAFELAPVVGELFAAAQDEAIAFRTYACPTISPMIHLVCRGCPGGGGGAGGVV